MKRSANMLGENSIGKTGLLPWPFIAVYSDCDQAERPFCFVTAGFGSFEKEALENEDRSTWFRDTDANLI